MPALTMCARRSTLLMAPPTRRSIATYRRAFGRRLHQ
jgi:hypothetical protein